ncbi:hypothetical protein [Hyphomonas sp.]|jgi:hypothetical protein|uniref:hypothetical protein n=1 Tax=Hyphomonas sp. TaxID=87 RepID=UPI0025C36C85|nr:hypothetical protein [Hyphomonas sp.]
MSFGGGSPGLRAIEALVAARGDFSAIADKDWAAAAGLIVKKLLVSAGQTHASLTALRDAVGEEIFDGQLKTLSHHQAKQLARRLDKAAPDLEVSTARAAIGYIRTLLTPAAAAEEPAPKAEIEIPSDPSAEETVAADPATDETVNAPSEDETPPSPPAGPNPYFGRKSFRTG